MCETSHVIAKVKQDRAMAGTQLGSFWFYGLVLGPWFKLEASGQCQPIRWRLMVAKQGLIEKPRHFLATSRDT